MVPWLCSDRVQRTLQRYGDLGLRLKINSHWVFSDVACGLYLGQPKSFLSEGEEVLDEIDPLVGLSPRLLNIYANVTGKLAEAKSHLVDGTGLRDGLQGLRQYIPHLEGLMGRKRTILENVASAYLHGAHLYILCRQERYVSHTPASGKMVILISTTDGLSLILRFSNIGTNSVNFWSLTSYHFLVISFELCGLYFPRSFFV